MSNPEFLDINGADNVFGGLGTAEGSGADDNFGLRKNSPAIDAANAYVASRHDIVGNQRHDDPSTLNTGTGWALYVEQDTAGNQFAETGAAQNWYAANSYWELTLPFAFPFYGTGYTSVQVSANGFLQFAGPDAPYGDTNSLEEFQRNTRIAPLWDNIRTYGTSIVSHFSLP